MAYGRGQSNTEHPSKTIVKMVTSAKETGVWPKSMLLTGREDFLIDWAKAYIKNAVINPAAEALDCVSFSDDADQNEIIEACETVALMSERKLVIARDVDEAAGPLTEYIPKLPESTLLLIINSKVNKTRMLYKTINKHGIVYDFTPLDDATLQGWMAKRLRAAGRAAKPEDLLVFAKSCGYGDPERNYTLFNLENDLKKVLAGSEKQVLRLDDFMDGSSAQAEVNAFKILDCAFSNKKGEAYTILHNSIDIQAPSKEMSVIMSFLGLLCSQLEIMVEGKEREESGQGYYDIISEMKVNEYRYKKAMGACRGKSAADLRQDLDNAFQIEKDLKNGNMDGYMALELFIAKL